MLILRMYFSFPPPNDRNPSWGKDKPKLDDDTLDDSMAGLRINNPDKQNMVDTGPPPFVPGQAWKGPVDHKDGKLDPYKNPDLTPGMADKLRNSNDFRGAVVSSIERILKSNNMFSQIRVGINQCIQHRVILRAIKDGLPLNKIQEDGLPLNKIQAGQIQHQVIFIKIFIFFILFYSDPIDRPSPNNTIPPNLLPADIFDNNQ